MLDDLFARKRPSEEVVIAWQKQMNRWSDQLADALRAVRPDPLSSIEGDLHSLVEIARWVSNFAAGADETNEAGRI